MRVVALAALCERVASTTKRLEKIAYLASFLHDLDEDEISPAVLIITGQIFPESSNKTLDLLIVAAEWGHGRRKGWLSNYHLATREGNVIGKTFKGLTDAQFRAITDRLLALKEDEDTYTVYVRPAIVVEVAFNEIQKSPQYESGYALRFARITAIRDDKSPQETNTLNDVEHVYEKQFRYKGRLMK
jgi:hypothetical protein